jgi:hypothetical protein
MSSVVVFAAGDSIPNMATQPVAEEGIPNLVTEDADTNGRATHLDNKGDEEGDELNPVERRIIILDAIISNAPALAN